MNCAQNAKLEIWALFSLQRKLWATKDKEETKMGPEVIIGIVVGAFALFIIALMVYAGLYRKIPPDVALVVSGGKETKAYFGGKVINPFTEKAQEISLNTMNLKVDREGAEALITMDSLRVDITAEFFVKIQAKGEAGEKDVLSAAASLGEKTATPENVKELLEGKLVGALRAVAATMTLQDLHEKRQDFQDAVQDACEDDLKQNGFTLETVSITNLDQTPLEQLNPDNRFDAVAIRTIQAKVLEEKLETERAKVESDIGIQEEEKRLEAETQRLKVEAELKIQEEETRQQAESAKLKAEAALLAQEEEMKKMTESARLEAEAEVVKNEEEVRAELEVEQKRINFDKQKLALEQALASSRAEQERAVKEAEIKKEQAVKEAEIRLERMLELARIEQEQEVKETEIAKQEAVEKAEIELSSAIEKAKVEQERMVEETRIKQAQLIEETKVAKNIALVEKTREEKEAKAESAIQIAEKQKESAIAETLKLTADADKTKAEEQVLTVGAVEEADREAKIKVIEAERKAEEEYIVKQRLADAEAYRITEKAEAERDAAKLKAEGMKLLAEAVLEELKATAEGEKELMEAKNTIEQKILTQEAAIALIKQLPEIAGQLMKPAEKIESIRILDMGAAGKAGQGGNGMSKIASMILNAGAVAPVLREVINLSGIDAGTLLQKVADYVPGLNQVIKTEEEPAVEQETEESDVAQGEKEESEA